MLHIAQLGGSHSHPTFSIGISPVGLVYLLLGVFVNHCLVRNVDVAVVNADGAGIQL